MSQRLTQRRAPQHFATERLALRRPRITDAAATCKAPVPAGQVHGPAAAATTAAVMTVSVT